MVFMKEKKNQWDIQVRTEKNFFTAAAALHQEAPDELTWACGRDASLDFSLVWFLGPVQKSSLCSIQWQNYVRQKDVFASNTIFLIYSSR